MELSDDDFNEISYWECREGMRRAVRKWHEVMVRESPLKDSPSEYIVVSTTRNRSD